MGEEFKGNIAAIGGMKAVPAMLDIACRMTGMRFAAVARVVHGRWIACSVKDEIGIGVRPGDEMTAAMTICAEVGQDDQCVVVDHVSEDPAYADNPEPKHYRFQSFISVPIHLSDGAFFGTLSALDLEPHRLDTPETIAMFETFADVIGFQLSAVDRHTVDLNLLDDERTTSALREQFIAVLGHDLRNPLAAIDGGMHLLLSTPLDTRGKVIVKMVQESATRMAGLIDNVMDFARGRLGGGISLERFDNQPIERIVRQIIGELHSVTPDRVIDSEFDIAASVNCDPRRFGQLVSNLIGNAISYGTAKTPVSVVAKTCDGGFELSVTNSGTPISPVALKSIFEPFSRGELGPSKQGLGLGLYISHEIATAHGGQLNVASTPDQTRFTFRMPLTLN